MTNDQNSLALPFPWPDTPALITAYNTLVAAAHADDATKQAIGSPATLPRPWDPPTCTDRRLRAELWTWLDKVVTWFNHEYVWDHTGAGLIPACWPRHPHLVHEIAVLADQRRRAGLDLTSGSLEEWHRYSVPAFIERLRQRTRTLCDEDHKPWPGRSRHTRYASTKAAVERQAAFDADLATSEPTNSRPRLRILDDDGSTIDAVTGEVLPD